MADEPQVLLHLSDIHFRYRGGFDLDADVRNELELDTAALAERLPPVSGVLVTGDAAFAGRAEEYATASDWLNTLCGVVGCAPERVWVVPGNHDVERHVIDGSPILQNIHQDLRPPNPAAVDERLRKYVADEIGGPLLLKPLTNYNQFAVQFGCAISPTKLYWEQDLPLNDGSVLRLRGVNSALISHSRDDPGANKLILGSTQATIRRGSGVAHMLLCHHPPDWLLDYEIVEDHLNSRVQVQLFGHKHRQRMQRVGNSLRLYAGAVHPAREEPGWEPRYNVLVVKVEGEDARRELVLQVWPRVWSAARTKFVPEYDDDGQPCHTYRLPLEAWRRPVAPPAVSAPPLIPAGPVASITYSPTVASEEVDMGPQRRLIYRFFSLPFHKRIEVAVRLGLLQDEDEGLEDNQLFERVLTRAESGHRLGDLWAEVEAQHGDAQGAPNPFA